MHINVNRRRFVLFSQDGVINKTLAIKSLPQRLLKNVLYGGLNLYEPHHTNNVTDDEDFAYTHHHVVYRVPSSEQYADFSKLLEYLRENVTYIFLNSNFRSSTFVLLKLMLMFLQTLQIPRRARMRKAMLRTSFIQKS